MRTTTSLLFVMTVAVALSGCGNPKTASNGNFMKAYSTQPKWVCTSFMVNRPDATHMSSLGGPSDKQLAALAEVGLLSSAGSTYEITDAGKAALGDGLISSMPSLCFGKRRPTSVVRFTEPSAANGVTMSQVTYTYEIADVPAWAHNANVAAAFPNIQTTLDKHDNSETLVMVLNSDGWRDSSVLVMKPYSDKTGA